MLGSKGDADSQGFNGGGKSTHSGEATYGGGASDIRVGGNGLYNRIIVAGEAALSNQQVGGYGGGVSDLTVQETQLTKDLVVHKQEVMAIIEVTSEKVEMEHVDIVIII